MPTVQEANFVFVDGCDFGLSAALTVFGADLEEILQNDWKPDSFFDLGNPANVRKLRPAAFLSYKVKPQSPSRWADKPQEYWKRFAGETNKTWQGLANELNSALVQRLGVSREHLDKWAPTLYAQGRGGVNRCLVRRCDVENPRNLPSYDHELKTALLVEFDLGTGEIKVIRFEDPELQKWQRQR